MVYKRNSPKTIIEAVVLCLLLLGTGFIMPAVSQSNPKTIVSNPDKTYSPSDNGPFLLDHSYILREENPAQVGTGDNDDAGMKKDASNALGGANNLYVGELIDETPGRGRFGKLTQSSDIYDWLVFPIAAGQQVHITMTPPAGFDYDLGIFNKSGGNLQNSTNPGSLMEEITYTSPTTAMIYMSVRFISGTGVGRYSFTIEMLTQNDANTGADASNTIGGAVLITAGTNNPGYLDMNDPYDWYTFAVTNGQWFNLSLVVKATALLTDYDTKLYDSSGTLLYASNNYQDDGFDYLATETGYWYARVEIFPGWVDCPHPTEWNYYSYGSGPYVLTLTEKATGTAVPGPIPQPQIIPIAKTFIVPNDPNSAKDEFGYLAAIPACNYLAGGQRYVAPIIYTGDETPTAYYDNATAFGTVADTTQYLVDDWNAYLATYGKTATQYTVPADPIQAAADIATHGWTSSQTAVVAVDGSSYNDTTKTVVKKTATIKHTAEVIEVQHDDPQLATSLGYLLKLGPKWGAVGVNVTGITVTNGNIAGALLDNLFPVFMPMSSDDWPTPYDGPGYSGDLYYPVTRSGFWSAHSDVANISYDKIIITKYPGDRFHFKVGSNDAVLSATVTTDTVSDLLVFLVDPNGNIRQPIPPAWNGPVNPIHIWNGGENPSYNPWRCWFPANHTTFSAEVLHPEKGTWTMIVTPRYPTGADAKYTATATVRTISADRTDAEISAANAAVIASINHYPLLYVTKNSVPAATSAAFTALGVTKVIFVERNNIGSAVRGSLSIDKDLTDMQSIVDAIKASPASENYIAVTSLKTDDGYFAPAAMLAAYHGAPVVSVADSPAGDAASMAERVQAWQRWDGDYYHGSRANGHMPQASAPVDQSKLKLFITLIKAGLSKNYSLIPDIGLDAKRYWNEEMYNNFHDYIVSLGLDREGMEGYVIVAPRDDINMELHSALMGNNSYAGDIPGTTPAYSSDIVVRDILYPALIFANPGKNYTTAQVLNYPEGLSFKLNDLKSHIARSSQAVKRAFSSHDRTFDGHTFWAAHVERMNEGASVFYYSGHGTGGSGMASMYPQTDTSHYPDQVWWDAWRGYMYDAWKMPRDCTGLIWFNPEPPELYEITHYKWVDQSFDNLHSNAIFYMSCTTGDGYAPLVYLDHGAVCWYGNANTGLCPEADVGDDAFFDLALIQGVPIGIAFAQQVWLHYRDFTTSDNASMYGPSSLYPVASIQVIYGDPALVVYSPDWTSPVPIDA